ncbi:MAG: hypothetical protein ACP5SI_12825 [Chloroflexia bacterium]
MENPQLLKHQIGYENLLRMIGRFCDEEHMDEIAVIEFDRGVVLQGLEAEETAEGYYRRHVTYSWSFSEIAEAIRHRKRLQARTLAQKGTEGEK